MLKIAALVSGGGTNLQAIIDSVESGRVNAQIELVISTNDHAYALKRAQNHGTPTVVLAKKDFENSAAREKALLDILKQKNIELVVLCGCMMVLSADFVRDWDKPIINVHPSLLPKYGGRGFYGLAVHEAVLAAGESITGATVHFVDSGIDTGSIILQKEVAVKDGDTPEILQKRVMEEAEWLILPEAIGLLAANLSAHIRR
jgi:phosphoribosylglycinamide formyltransferase-1